jgi:hypothetical protein
VSFVTALSDGCILLSDRSTTLPHSRLVVNAVRGASCDELLRRHNWVLGQLSERGVRPVATTPAAWAEAMRTEIASFDMMGPLLGAFVSVSGARGWGRLMVRLRPLWVLRLALPDVERLPRRDRVRLRLERVATTG